MKIRILTVAILALFLPVLAAGCGDDSTGDLSTEEISEQFQEGGIPKEQADCIAVKVKDADLTQDELDEFNEEQDESSKAGKVLMEAVTTCVTTASAGS